MEDQAVDKCEQDRTGKDLQPLKNIMRQPQKAKNEEAFRIGKETSNTLTATEDEDYPSGSASVSKITVRKTKYCKTLSSRLDKNPRKAYCAERKEKRKKMKDPTFIDSIEQKSFRAKTSIDKTVRCKENPYCKTRSPDREEDSTNTSSSEEIGVSALPMAPTLGFIDDESNLAYVEELCRQYQKALVLGERERIKLKKKILFLEEELLKESELRIMCSEYIVELKKEIENLKCTIEDKEKRLTTAQHSTVSNSSPTRSTDVPRKNDEIKTEDKEQEKEQEKILRKYKCIVDDENSKKSSSKSRVQLPVSSRQEKIITVDTSEEISVRDNNLAGNRREKLMSPDVTSEVEHKVLEVLGEGNKILDTVETLCTNAELEDPNGHLREYFLIMRQHNQCYENIIATLGERYKGPLERCHILEELMVAQRRCFEKLWHEVLKGLKVDLSESATTGSPNIMKYLLSQGSNAFHVNAHGYTLLHKAVTSGNVFVVEILLNAGLDLDACNFLGMSAFHLTCWMDCIAVAYVLMRRGCKINLPDSRHFTPLHIVSFLGNLIMCKLLLEAGADIEATDINGDTPFMNAAIADNLNIAEMLLAYGARIDTVNNIGNTPLHVAAWQNNIDFACFILDCEIEVDVKNSFDLTPLDLAVMYGHCTIVEVLLDAEASVEMLHENGNTLLHWVAESGNVEIAELLVQHNANINSQNAMKRTPLHVAALNSHGSICELLINEGANVNIPDIELRTPLHMAVQHKSNISLVQILVAAGANIRTKDKFGMAPIDLSIHCKNDEIFEFILSKVSR